MTHGNGASRGDRNRNARLAQLSELVPLTNAIVAIDPADMKQMVMVCDHDSKVLARRTFRCKAWALGGCGFGLGRAASPSKGPRRGHGLVRADRVPVAGARSAGRGRGMPFVCVQPMQTSWARRSEDLTFDKADDKDAVLIARLAARST